MASASGDSDMAFIKIRMTDELEDIGRRSLADRVVSPFVVHRSPELRVKDDKPQGDDGDLSGPWSRGAE